MHNLLNLYGRRLLFNYICYNEYLAYELHSNLLVYLNNSDVLSMREIIWLRVVESMLQLYTRRAQLNIVCICSGRLRGNIRGLNLSRLAILDLISFNSCFWPVNNFN